MFCMLPQALSQGADCTGTRVCRSHWLRVCEFCSCSAVAAVPRAAVAVCCAMLRGLREQLDREQREREQQERHQYKAGLALLLNMLEAMIPWLRGLLGIRPNEHHQPLSSRSRRLTRGTTMGAAAAAVVVVVVVAAAAAAAAVVPALPMVLAAVAMCMALAGLVVTTVLLAAAAPPARSTAGRPRRGTS